MLSRARPEMRDSGVKSFFLFSKMNRFACLLLKDQQADLHRKVLLRSWSQTSTQISPSLPTRAGYVAIAHSVPTPAPVANA